MSSAGRLAASWGEIMLPGSGAKPPCCSSRPEGPEAAEDAAGDDAATGSSPTNTMLRGKAGKKSQLCCSRHRGFARCREHSNRSGDTSQGRRPLLSGPKSAAPAGHPSKAKSCDHNSHAGKERGSPLLLELRVRNERDAQSEWETSAHSCAGGEENKGEALWCCSGYYA